jgi:hypothetical protein
LLIAVRGISTSPKGQHDLYNRIKAIETSIPEFREIREKIEEMDPMLMAHRFPGNLRYTETPADIEQYVKVLIRMVFKTRRLVKRCLYQEDAL